MSYAGNSEKGVKAMIRELPSWEKRLRRKYPLFYQLEHKLKPSQVRMLLDIERGEEIVPPKMSKNESDDLSHLDNLKLVQYSDNISEPTFKLTIRGKTLLRQYREVSRREKKRKQSET
jgi:hypothetical protein